MQYDPTRPTIAGLLAARRSSAFFRTEPTATPGIEGLLVESLSSALRPGVAIVRRPVIDTPTGERIALVAVTGRGRRIAVVESAGSDGSEALVLVYGTFDAVYVVSRRDLTTSAPRVAAELSAREPRLFTERGRTAMALSAVSVGHQPARDRKPVHAGRMRSTTDLRVLRLNRPVSWADAFETSIDGVERPAYRRSA